MPAESPSSSLLDLLNCGLWINPGKANTKVADLFYYKVTIYGHRTVHAIITCITVKNFIIKLPPSDRHAHNAVIFLYSATA